MHNQVVIIKLFQNVNGNNNNNANNANAAFVNNNNVINNRRGSKSGDELFGQGTGRFNQVVKIACDIDISTSLWIAYRRHRVRCKISNLYVNH